MILTTGHELSTLHMCRVAVGGIGTGALWLLLCLSRLSSVGLASMLDAAGENIRDAVFLSSQDSTLKYSSPA